MPMASSSSNRSQCSPLLTSNMPSLSSKPPTPPPPPPIAIPTIGAARDAAHTRSLGSRRTSSSARGRKCAVLRRAHGAREDRERGFGAAGSPPQQRLALRVALVGFAGVPPARVLRRSYTVVAAKDSASRRIAPLFVRLIAWGKKKLAWGFQALQHWWLQSLMIPRLWPGTRLLSHVHAPPFFPARVMNTRTHPQRADPLHVDYTVTWGSGTVHDAYDIMRIDAPTYALAETAPWLEGRRLRGEDVDAAPGHDGAIWSGDIRPVFLCRHSPPRVHASHDIYSLALSVTHFRPPVSHPLLVHPRLTPPPSPLLALVPRPLLFLLLYPSSPNEYPLQVVFHRRRHCILGVYEALDFDSVPKDLGGAGTRRGPGAVGACRVLRAVKGTEAGLGIGLCGIGGNGRGTRWLEETDAQSRLAGLHPPLCPLSPSCAFPPRLTNPPLLSLSLSPSLSLANSPLQTLAGVLIKPGAHPVFLPIFRCAPNACVVASAEDLSRDAETEMAMASRKGNRISFFGHRILRSSNFGEGEGGRRGRRGVVSCL
ncbi:hypothetical protein DFH06DRAFT_1376230 [Mycena polygramma]|nr:hypothetical protein DFH06DRAFT_1376230 [Mycena polygramma]